jgi:O-antigen ligase
MGGARIFSFSASAAEGSVDSMLSRSLLLFTYLITLVVLTTSPNALPVMRRCWPVLALPAVATLSTLWSANPKLTLQSALSYWSTTLLGCAIATLTPPAITLRIVLRAMGYICLLSVVCAVFFPELGVHQATDDAKTIHAGLWRGILGHKVALGIIAGLTFALLIYYRGAIVSNWLWPIMAACAFACLLNADSTTGFVGAGILLMLLIIFGIILRLPPQDRIHLINVILMVVLIVLVLSAFGFLNRLATLVGKSSDLTGRTDMWPLISAAVWSNPLGVIFGYGYVAGTRAFVMPAAGLPYSDCHNGFLEVIVAFGYGGAVLVLWVHVWLYRNCRLLLLASATKSAKLAALPMSLVLVGAFLNESESLLMSFSWIFAQLTPIIASWCFYVPSYGSSMSSSSSSQQSASKVGDRS